MSCQIFDPIQKPQVPFDFAASCYQPTTAEKSSRALMDQNILFRTAFCKYVNLIDIMFFNKKSRDQN